MDGNGGELACHTNIREESVMPVVLERPTSEQDTPASLRVPITHETIELRAYYRYSNRGCLDGFALEDWLEAERELRQETKHDDAPPGESCSLVSPP